MKKNVLIGAGIIAGCLCLAGCSLVGEHVATVSEVLSEQVAAGHMTQAQLDLVMAALHGIAGGDWSWLVDVGEAAASLVLGFLGIRIWRGGVNARMGSAPA